MSPKDVKCRDLTDDVPERKSWIVPAVGIVVFGLLLYWFASHIYGECMGISDIFKVCSFTIK